MPVTNSRTADKFVLRLPNGMRSKIADQAFSNNRSMNSEIVERLELSLYHPSSDGWTPVIGMLVTYQGTVCSIHEFKFEPDAILVKLKTNAVLDKWVPLKAITPYKV